MKIFFLFLLLVSALACGKSSDKPSKLSHHEEIQGSEYFSLMNEYRVKLGLNPLKYATIIEEEAIGHSSWMAQKGIFGHIGWRERCRRLKAKMNSVACGEIVARGQETSSDVLLAWLNSPSHRESIENPNWTHTGVGMVENSKGQKYWTQVFLTIK